jgi:hypothetical protein
MRKKLFTLCINKEEKQKLVTAEMKFIIVSTSPFPSQQVGEQKGKPSLL